MTYAAYDYAADARGYSWGGVAELCWDVRALRFGRFAQPKRPNQVSLDAQILRHFGVRIEIERRYLVAKLPGTVRLVGMRNRARMACYQDALSRASITDGTPSLDALRYRTQDKARVGVAVEQKWPASMGSFCDFRADATIETYAFTEADRSMAGWIVAMGRRCWNLGYNSAAGPIEVRPAQVHAILYGTPASHPT